jgi:glutamate---cysteine ligase / carboxylate-amine ligase
LNTRDDISLVKVDAFETGVREGTLGAEEELWLADPETLKLAGGAQEILDVEPAKMFSGELIDCEIESNTGVHDEPSGVADDLVLRRRVLLGHARRLGRVLGISGTHPIGDWREQEIIDKPHYQRLKEKLGWLIRRNNTFSLHVHYAVNGRDKAVYLFNRLREYVPHMLALSVNSPFWQGEYTDMHSVRVLMFSRAYHRAGLPEPLHSWDEYVTYVDTLKRTGLIDTLGEIWWDVRLHPGLSTVEIRAFDAQTSPARTEALVTLAAALCDMLAAEFESGDHLPIHTNRDIEENKWSAQRYGLEGTFINHETGEAVETPTAIASLIVRLSETSNRDLSSLTRMLDEPTESTRQLEVWHDTGSTVEVAKDLVNRTSARSG